MIKQNNKFTCSKRKGFIGITTYALIGYVFYFNSFIIHFKFFKQILYFRIGTTICNTQFQIVVILIFYRKNGFLQNVNRHIEHGYYYTNQWFSVKFERIDFSS